MCSSPVPFVDGVRGLVAVNTVMFQCQALRVLLGTTGFLAGPFDAVHPCKNLEGKVRIEANRGDTLRQERVRCAMGFGGSPGVGTVSDGWCTLGDRRNIGDDVFAECRSAGGSFLLARTLRIVARGVTTRGGGVTCVGEECD